MRVPCYLTALVFCLQPALFAAVTEQDAYARISEGLREEVRLLTGVTDAESARAAVEPLRRTMHTLAALNDEVDERELWRYIDNTPNLKQPLIEEMERLFVQLQRLEKAECYHCEPLQELLAPLLSPAS